MISIADLPHCLHFVSDGSRHSTSSQEGGGEETQSWSRGGEYSIHASPKRSNPSTITVLDIDALQLSLFHKASIDLESEEDKAKEGSATFSSFATFRLQYILAYIGIMLADGLQGKSKDNYLVSKQRCS